jgi:hypothetical protein
MASLSGKLKKIRNRKKTKAGADRKKKLQKHGSTPKFVIHQEGESAPAKE